MKAKEFLKSKGINYNHEATGMCVYVQNAGNTINAIEKLLYEYSELRLSDVSNQRELLIAYNKHILDRLTEYEGDEICDKMVDDFIGNL